LEEEGSEKDLIGKLREKYRGQSGNTKGFPKRITGTKDVYRTTQSPREPWDAMKQAAQDRGW
jgi:hypothetical protein